MPSLQLLRLKEHGRGFLASRRKSLLLATGVLAAGGAAAYLQSRLSHKQRGSFRHCNGPGSFAEDSENGIASPTVHEKRRKRSGLRSLQVLTAILLSQMGRRGARDLLALVGVVVLRTAVSNRLAKVQGYLFRAAFLCRVPSFFQIDN